MASKGRISFADPKNDINENEIKEAFEQFNYLKVEKRNDKYYIEFKTALAAINIVEQGIEIKGHKLDLKYAPLPPEPKPKNEEILTSTVWVEKKSTSENNEIYYYNVITNETSWVKPEVKNGITLMKEQEFENISDAYFEKHQSELKKHALKANMIQAQKEYDKFMHESGLAAGSSRSNPDSNNSTNRGSSKYR